MRFENFEAFTQAREALIVERLNKVTGADAAL